MAFDVKRSTSIYWDKNFVSVRDTWGKVFFRWPSVKPPRLASWIFYGERPQWYAGGDINLPLAELRRFQSEDYKTRQTVCPTSAKTIFLRRRRKKRTKSTSKFRHKSHPREWKWQKLREKRKKVFLHLHDQSSRSIELYSFLHQDKIEKHRVNKRFIFTFSASERVSMSPLCVRDTFVRERSSLLGGNRRRSL